MNAPPYAINCFVLSQMITNAFYPNKEEFFISKEIISSPMNNSHSADVAFVERAEISLRQQMCAFHCQL